MSEHKIIRGDCADVLASMEPDSVDAIVTDPPYGLSFMGKEWDSFGTDTRQPGDEHYWVPDNPYGRSGVRYGWNQDKSKLAKSNRAFQDGMIPIFTEALRVAKPGAHLLCFGGTRTFHRMACAIEDAGWEIRDCIMWVYGSGFPKSMNVGKAIDKALGAEREKVPNPLAKKQTGQSGTFALNDKKANEYIYPTPTTEQGAQWDGWGTCLKPAWEPIIVARKPLDGTVVHNVMEHGTGAINIDACRVATDDTYHRPSGGLGVDRHAHGDYRKVVTDMSALGRFPANLVHDGSDEVTALTNDAARFFYCAKASKSDRGEGNDHPTVKPTALMGWLVRLVCRKGGTVLDPFCGSGSTGVACVHEGMAFVGIERDDHYADIAEGRIADALTDTSQGTLF